MTNTEKFFATIGSIILGFSLFLGHITTSYSEELLVARGNNVVIILTQEPCVSTKVGEAHPGKDLSIGFTANIMWKGKPLEACWLLDATAGAVYLIDETGDEGYIPIQAFKASEGI